MSDWLAWPLLKIFRQVNLESLSTMQDSSREIAALLYAYMDIQSSSQHSTYIYLETLGWVYKAE